MKTISRYIMTLALLLTAVTGAWAISDPNAVYWDYQTWTGWEENVTTHTVGDITITATGSGKVYHSKSSGDPLALQAGANDAITFTSNGKPFASVAIMTGVELNNVAGWTYNSSERTLEWSGEPTTSVTLSGCDINADYIIFTFGTAEAPKVYASGEVGLFSLQAGDILMPGVTLTNSDVNNIAGANLISNRYSIDGVISPYGGNAISSIPFSIGENGLLTAQLAGNGPYNCMPITEDGKAGNAWVVTDVFAEPDYKTILIGGTTYPAASGPEVAWNAATKTGTFTMPGSDVVLTPLYAPAAKWDVVENVEQLPAALEGIIAGQDAAIVTAGQSAQGTVMYAVTTSAEAAPELSVFSATVPTAKDYDDATTLYVWYYIQGKDTPDGQEATEENTFNDTEICTTPLTVQVLSNKFDITFNAANANTIEAGKATVKVGDEAAEVKEGKLTGVKMGSEVKLEAKPGYKFRKVEVKKKEATPLDNTSTAWADGAFAVPEGGMTYSRVINVSGNVTLTLPAGTTLTINGGINLECGATLTIEGEGAMQVNGTAGHNVDMAGSNHGAKAGHGTDAIKGCETSKLIVNGGTVTAAGGNGGYVYTTDQSANMCDGGNGGAGISVALTVNGGTLTAIGGTGGTHANSWNGKDGTNGQGINSTFTAGTGISFSDSDNGTDWTANTGTSSTKQYVKAE